MKDCLIFSFHQQGCTIFLCKNDLRWMVGELSAYDLLRLGIETRKLSAFMEHGTESYFYPENKQGSTSTQVPQAFYNAFGEGGQ